MADSASILKEFLVKIGFKVDETKYRRFQEVMRTTAKHAVEMSKTTLAATTVMGASLRAAAQQMEGLYYATRRTGASARELKDFSFATQQIGISAEQARSAIEGLAASRRMNPGLSGILGSMGINSKQTDNARVLIELLGKLRSMPYYQGAQIAGMFGINEQTFFMLEQGLPKMQKWLALRDKMFAAAGINPAPMTARSHEFMNHMRALEAALGNLADIIAYRLMPWGEKVIDWLSEFVSWLTRADKATSGWSSKLLGVMAALAGGSILKGGLGFIGKLFGGAGGAAAAGGEGAAAAAGGGGLLAGIISIPAIVLATLAAIALNGSIASRIAQTVNKVFGLKPNSVHDFFAGMAHKIGHAVTNIYHSGVSSFERMVATFEGHAKHGYGDYKDAAGHLTAGFGHLVRPGEHLGNLSRSGALALLASDLHKAMATVLRLVKVHLTGNQLRALTDFEFNIGEKHFAHSTLLRLLNAGNYSGAANQFQYWNHALVKGHLVALAGLTERRAADARLFRTPDRPVMINVKSDYHIASTDPRGAAAEVEQRQRGITADLVRNLSGAAVQ